MKKRAKTILKRIVAVVISLVLLPFVFCGIFLLAVPISRPNKAVHSYVIRKIPLGTSCDRAVEIIKKRGWEIDTLRTDRGLRINDAASNVDFANSDEMVNDSDNEKIRIVGVKAMRVELGEYYGPFDTAVFAYLAFDENDELVEVAIRRDIDGI